MEATGMVHGSSYAAGAPFRTPQRRMRGATRQAARVCAALSLAVFATRLTGCAGAVTNVTIVHDAVALKRAIDGGKPHVHITNHLDLTSLPLVLNPFDASNGKNDTALFWPRNALQSITVRPCDASSSIAALQLVIARCASCSNGVTKRRGSSQSTSAFGTQTADAASPVSMQVSHRELQLQLPLA
jgi:hypothetical protein